MFICILRTRVTVENSRKCVFVLKHCSYWERNIELSALKLRQQQGNKHRNKVCKFKLYYPREFRVSRSTKISHNLRCHMTPRSLGCLCFNKENDADSKAFNKLNNDPIFFNKRRQHRSAQLYANQNQIVAAI